MKCDGCQREDDITNMVWGEWWKFLRHPRQRIVSILRLYCKSCAEPAQRNSDYAIQMKKINPSIIVRNRE